MRCGGLSGKQYFWKRWVGNIILICLAHGIPSTGQSQSCPESIGRWPYGQTRSVAVSGNYTYFSSGTAFRIADISDPASPALLGEAVLDEQIWGIAISAPHAYLAGYNSGLIVLDISNPGAPWKCGELDLAGPALDLAISGNFAFVVSWPGGMSVVDITDPTNPVLAGSLAGSGSTGIDIIGTMAYVTDIGYGLRTIDITDPIHPAASNKECRPFEGLIG